MKYKYEYEYHIITTYYHTVLYLIIISYNNKLPSIQRKYFIIDLQINFSPVHFLGLKDLFKALVDLLKNKTYVFSSLALTIKIIFAAALGGFYTKVLVLKFGGTFSEVALYSAAVFIPGNTRTSFFSINFIKRIV